MPIQEQLHRFLLELLGVRTPRANLSLRLCLCHWIVLPLPCRIRSWTVQKNPSTSVDQVKMFRNLPGIAFERRIHEQVLPSIQRLGGRVERTGIFVVHSGGDTTPEGRRRKYERDL